MSTQTQSPEQERNLSEVNQGITERVQAILALVGNTRAAANAIPGETSIPDTVPYVPQAPTPETPVAQSAVKASVELNIAESQRSVDEAFN